MDNESNELLQKGSTKLDMTESIQFIVTYKSVY